MAHRKNYLNHSRVEMLCSTNVNKCKTIFDIPFLGDDTNKIQQLINDDDLDHSKQVMPYIVRKNVYCVLTTIVDDKNSTFD